MDRYFVDLGLQYYVAGRIAALAGQAPIYGNLLHHAIEMLFKAVMSRTKSPAQLKADYSHRLPPLWDDVKALGIGSATHDKSIAALHEFESIRYPDKIAERGAMYTIIFKSEHLRVPTSYDSPPQPFYNVVINEVDELVIAVLDYLKYAPGDWWGLPGSGVGESLREQNPWADRW